MGAGIMTPCVHTIFFHPDYTVGLGISPNHALRLVGFTTGGESHPALKILIQLRQVYVGDAKLSIPFLDRGHFTERERADRPVFLGGLGLLLSEARMTLCTNAPAGIPLDQFRRQQTLGKFRPVALPNQLR